MGRVVMRLFDPVIAIVELGVTLGLLPSDPETPQAWRDRT